MNNDELKILVRKLVEQYATKELKEGYKPEAIHVYDDESGNILYIRPRLKHPNGDKWIRPFHCDVAKQEWVKAEPIFNGGKPLYHLSALAKNPKSEVWVVEGEQKVDRLEMFDFIATTSGGCKSASAADWSPLRNRNVTIWPDNNKVGFDYAQEVAEILKSLNSTIRFIVIDELNLPEGGDVVDWLKDNPDATRDDINNLLMTDELTSIIEAEEWPQLIPLDSPNLPRLNLATLPSWVGDYARALSIATETPPELAAGLVLVTCATAAARRFKVMVNLGYFEPCNLWIVVALPPGNRKSAVQSAVTSPLVSWEKIKIKTIEPEIKQINSKRKTMEARVAQLRTTSAKDQNLDSANMLAQQAADLETELPEVPVSPQLWTSDATPERLGVLLAEQDERMAWLSSEAGIFDLLQGRYSKGIPNLDLILKSHSGDSERVDRGSRPPVYLHSPLLSIGLSPQPDVLRGLAGKDGFRGRGLLGRFLYLLPPSPLGYRSLKTSPIAENISNAYVAGVKAMLDWEALAGPDNETMHILRLSEEAYSEWLSFSLSIEANMRPGGNLEYLTDWAGKAPGAAVRIAGILHGIKHAHGSPWNAVITAETMNSALEIMSVITHHSLAAFDLMGVEVTISDARYVWSWIERIKSPTFIIRDAFNILRGHFSKMKPLKDALEILEERGYIDFVESPNKGPGRPPSPTVRVRPEIVKSWQ